MKADAVTFDDELDELEDFDDEAEEESGLSGLVVLLMGVVILGALASVIWIAYQNGVRNGQAQGGAPYVQADPEPLKIENTAAAEAKGGDLAVYDKLDGRESDPVEVIAEGPEEPVNRTTDPIAAVAATAGKTTGLADDAVADRIAALAKADEALNSGSASTSPPATEAPAVKPEPKPATQPTAASTGSTSETTAATTAPKPTVSYRTGAQSGTHLVQIGAFRSEAEATAQWTKLQGKLGDYASGKSEDIERADLGDKGVYYRLRVGPFVSKDEASTYCAGLKERGTDCLIKAK